MSPPNPSDPRHPAAPESLLSQEGAGSSGSEDQPSKKGSRVTQVLKNFPKSLSPKPPSSTLNASKVQERWLLSGKHRKISRII